MNKVSKSKYEWLILNELYENCVSKELDKEKR